MNRMFLLEQFLPAAKNVHRLTGIPVAITIKVPHDVFDLVYVECAQRMTYPATGFLPPLARLQLHDQIWIERGE